MDTTRSDRPTAPAATAAPTAPTTRPTTPGAGAARGAALDPVVASCRALTKVYGSGATAVRALDAVDLDLERGRFTAIMGASGSGKSTLLHCLAGLDRPTAGTVTIDGTDLTRLGDRELTLLRRARVGFVFQSFNLLPVLTAEQNILLPLRLARARVDRAWFATVVGTLGLGDRLGHRPSELSGGQQQRVAVARALLTRPSLLVADEPTGALDSHTSADMLGFLRSCVTSTGQTVVMVTHDPRAAAHADRIVHLADGRIERDERAGVPA